MQQLFYCGNCGAQNNIGNKFCVKCGQSFEYQCPQCDAVINMNHKFCPGCGIMFNWDTAGTAGFQQQEDEFFPQQPETSPQVPTAQVAEQKELEQSAQQKELAQHRELESQKEAAHAVQQKPEIIYKVQSGQKPQRNRRTIWLIAFIVIIVLIIAVFIVDMYFF